MDTLIDLNSKPIRDELFHIPSLFCPVCNEWMNFYLSDSEPRCECCHEQLTPTKEELESVSKFLEIYPRSACFRFKKN